MEEPHSMDEIDGYLPYVFPEILARSVHVPPGPSLMIYIR